jgi:O-methyltransferase
MSFPPGPDFETKPQNAGPPSYSGDFMATWIKSVDFLSDPRFVSAYQRGMQNGHSVGRPRGSTTDTHVEWRVHVCCALAQSAKRLPGHFVECGVNCGLKSLAVCEYIDFNATGKNFYLFDTFCGIPVEQMSERERALGREADNRMFFECWDLVQRNFAPFPNAKLIRGKVPETLTQVDIDQVCYLSIDMNIAYPERAALDHFWDRLAIGAPVILDDYGWLQYREQKEVHDAFAQARGIEIVLLPTGQGLLIKT